MDSCTHCICESLSATHFAHTLGAMESGRRLFAPCTTLLDGPNDSVVDVAFNCNGMGAFTAIALGARGGLQCDSALCPQHCCRGGRCSGAFRTSSIVPVLVLVVLLVVVAVVVEEVMVVVSPVPPVPTPHTPHTVHHQRRYIARRRMLGCRALRMVPGAARWQRHGDGI